MTGSAAKPAQPVAVKVTPDLAKRLAKFRSVEMPVRSAQLTANERKMVDQLVEACHYLEGIFWRQMDPEALALYQIPGRQHEPARHSIAPLSLDHASRFDLIDENKPFVGQDPVPPGRGFLSPGPDACAD